MSVTAVVLIKSHPARIGELAQAVAEVDGVTEVFSVAGRYDLVAIVRVRRNEDLAEVVSQRLHAIPGCMESETLIAFRVYSNVDVDSGFALGMNE